MSDTDFHRRFIGILRWSVAISAAALGGCTLATPFRGAAQDYRDALRELPPEQTVIVAITHAVLDRSKRGPFDRHSRYTVEQLASFPGLIGYSVRIQFLGDEVWTMTVWRSDEEREAFVHSDLHREAMAAGKPAIRQMRFARVTLPAEEIPIPWSRAMELLDQSDAEHSGI